MYEDLPLKEFDLSCCSMKDAAMTLSENLNMLEFTSRGINGAADVVYHWLQAGSSFLIGGVRGGEMGGLP